MKIADWDVPEPDGKEAANIIAGFIYIQDLALLNIDERFAEARKRVRVLTVAKSYLTPDLIVFPRTKQDGYPPCIWLCIKCDLHHDSKGDGE